MECPKCHSTDVKKRGIAHLAGGKKQACQCKTCRHMFLVEIVKEPVKVATVVKPVKKRAEHIIGRMDIEPGYEDYPPFQYCTDKGWVQGHGEPATKEELAGAIERLGKQRVEELRAEAEAEERRMPPIGAFFGGIVGGH